jgi:hypothetical protein
MQIRSDGWFQFEGKIGPSNTLAKIYRYDIGMSLPGGFNYAVHGSFGRECVGCTGRWYGEWAESGNSVFISNNFLAAANGLQRAALNPYIKVTKSLLF